VHTPAAPFYQPPQTYAIVLSQNQFSSAQPANCRFASSNFTLQDHILSTIGDALKGPSSSHIKSSKNKLGNFPSLKEYLASGQV